MFQTVLLQFPLEHFSMESPQSPFQISVVQVSARSFLTHRTVFSRPPALGLTDRHFLLAAPDFNGFLHFRNCCHHSPPVNDHQDLLANIILLPRASMVDPHPSRPFSDSHTSLIH